MSELLLPEAQTTISIPKSWLKWKDFIFMWGECRRRSGRILWAELKEGSDLVCLWLCRDSRPISLLTPSLQSFTYKNGGMNCSCQENSCHCLGVFFSCTPDQRWVSSIHLHAQTNSHRCFMSYSGASARGGWKVNLAAVGLKYFPLLCVLCMWCTEKRSRASIA